MTKEQSQLDTNEAIVKRLNALIRLFIEMNKPEGRQKFTEGDAARLLKSVDLTPTEIAKILKKSSATDVSPYLYSKKKPARTDIDKVSTKQEAAESEEKTKDDGR
jgi:hypothetical protein